MYFGLIGQEIEWSLSREIFAGWGIEYRNFELGEIDELPELLRKNPELGGFNVTRPFKEAVLRFMGTLDEVACEVGAVNCVVVRARTGELHGYNTDAIALRVRARTEQLLASSSEYLVGYNTDAIALREIFADFSDDGRALILGTGGAAKAAKWALDRLGREATMVSRTVYPTYGDIDIADFSLIINATPASRPPIDYAALGPQHTLFDMTYNPAETEFLCEGRTRAARTENGMRMLIRQAELSRETFFN